MAYRYLATTLPGLVQQIAVGYVARGYRFYVRGTIPDPKSPELIDRKLIEKYGIDISKAERSRRKLLGRANVQYIRYKRLFFLLATEGEHKIRDEEKLLDLRTRAIQLNGYSISYRAGHPHVRIAERQFQEIKALFIDDALKLSAEELARSLRSLPYEPYAPIKGQFFSLLRSVNRIRKTAGLPLVSHEALRLLRKPLRPFDPVPDGFWVPSLLLEDLAA